MNIYYITPGDRLALADENADYCGFYCDSLCLDCGQCGCNECEENCHYHQEALAEMSPDETFIRQLNWWRQRVGWKDFTANTAFVVKRLF